MPSPFPGMDPYLEDPAFWHDFHDSFVTFWSGALNEVLPDPYEARINNRRMPEGTTASSSMPLVHLDPVRELYLGIRRRP